MSLIIFFNLVAIGPRGIRVNSVNPAAVKTDMFNKPDGPGGSNEKKQAVSNEDCMICYVINQDRWYQNSVKVSTFTSWPRLYKAYFCQCSVCVPILTHWGREKEAGTSHTTFSNVFSWMKIYGFRLIFRWSMFLRVKVTEFQHWVR